MRKITEEISTWKEFSKSPYSESFYDSKKIDWDFKPEGSKRISDHWNFESWGKLHCETTVYVQNGKWYLGIFKNGKYEIIEELEKDFNTWRSSLECFEFIFRPNGHSYITKKYIEKLLLKVNNNPNSEVLLCETCGFQTTIGGDCEC